MSGWGTVILAAGQGLRMKSKLPKVLHPLCGKAMLLYPLEAVREASAGPAIIVTGPHDNTIHTLLQDTVEYAVQPERKGTGHALLQTRPLAEGRFDNLLVLYSDTPLIGAETLRRMMERHVTSEATITLLTSTLTPTDGLGRIVRGPSGHITAIVEEAEADEEERSIREVNGGVYCFNARWLWGALKALRPSRSGETYLTDLVRSACASESLIQNIQSDDPREVLGINNRMQLAQVESLLRQRIREHWMLEGVTLLDPPSTFIDATASIGRDCTILPNTTIAGKSNIGEDCQIGPNTVIVDSSVGKGCRITASVIEGATLEDGVEVGPFSHLRPESYIESGVHIGNFGEVKKSRLGRGTQMGHFSYIGDATVGRNVNIGAGTITCNFDGVRKNPTDIGDDVFIGSDTMLVAPVKIGKGARTGAGAVVTKDVPPNTLVVGVPARAVKPPGARPKQARRKVSQLPKKGSRPDTSG